MTSTQLGAIMTDEQRRDVAKAIVETYLGFPAPDREPCDLDLKAADAAISALLSASKPAAQVVMPVCPHPCRYAHSFDHTVIAASPAAPAQALDVAAKTDAEAQRAAFERLTGWAAMTPYEVFSAGWRAARAASLQALPAQTRALTDEQIRSLEMAVGLLWAMNHRVEAKEVRALIPQPARGGDHD